MPYFRKKMRRSEAAKYRKPNYITRIARPIIGMSNTTRLKKFKTMLDMETPLFFNFGTGDNYIQLAFPLINHLSLVHGSYLQNTCDEYRVKSFYTKIHIPYANPALNSNEGLVHQLWVDPTVELLSGTATQTPALKAFLNRQSECKYITTQEGTGQWELTI